MRKVAIIQARVGSKRLSGKVLMPLAGKPMIEHIIDRVVRAGLVDDVCIASPRNDANRAIFERYKTKVLVYLSSVGEDDLIGRYMQASEAMEADIIIRICADNPLIEPSEIDRAIECYLECPQIYISNMHEHNVRYTISNIPNCYPDGIGCEVFSHSTLKWMHENLTSPVHREHPHMFFHEIGKITSPQCPIEFARPDLKLDVNTQEEYEFVKGIFDNLYPSNPKFGIKEIITLLDAENMAERGV